MARGDVCLGSGEGSLVLQKKDKETGSGRFNRPTSTRERRTLESHFSKQRAEDREGEWRSVLKQEAERYREGWKDAMLYIDTEFELEPGMMQTLKTLAVKTWYLLLGAVLAALVVENILLRQKIESANDGSASDVHCREVEQHQRRVH